VEERSAALYAILLQDSADIYLDLVGKRLGISESEILFGHLVRELAMRIARSEVQLELLTAKALCDVTIRLPSHPPTTSQEAAQFIASENFGALVELLIALKEGVAVGSVNYVVESPSIGRNTRLGTFSRVHNFLAYPLRKMGRSSEVLVVSPYIGRWRELLLKARLKLPPIFFEIRPRRVGPESWPVTARRTSLPFSELDSTSSSTLLRILLLECLPSALLEMQDRTFRHSVVLGFPDAPRTIFTSNAYDTDDVFKTYLVAHRSRVHYVVGQHGNNYGVARFSNPCPEIRTSDRFLSWAWSGSNVEPIGQLKPIIQPVQRPFAGVVLVLRDRLEQFTAHDSDFSFPEYLKEVFDLAERVSNSGIRVFIRSHPSDHEIVSDAFSRLELVQRQKITLQARDEPLRRAYENKLAPVFCYDSTGVLEIASAKGEVFVFSPDGLDHVEPKFMANYETLRTNGLLETDPRLAAIAIIDWFNSSEPERYRNALQRFATGIVSRPTRLVAALARVLNSRYSALQSEDRL
jgi:putative transferase (TIGR04331 family)